MYESFPGTYLFFFSQFLKLANFRKIPGSDRIIKDTVVLGKLTISIIQELNKDEIKGIRDDRIKFEMSQQRWKRLDYLETNKFYEYQTSFKWERKAKVGFLWEMVKVSYFPSRKVVQINVVDLHCSTKNGPDSQNRR